MTVASPVEDCDLLSELLVGVRWVSWSELADGLTVPSIGDEPCLGSEFILEVLFESAAVTAAAVSSWDLLSLRDPFLDRLSLDLLVFVESEPELSLGDEAECFRLVSGSLDKEFRLPSEVDSFVTEPLRGLDSEVDETLEVELFLPSDFPGCGGRDSMGDVLVGCMLDPRSVNAFVSTGDRVTLPSVCAMVLDADVKSTLFVSVLVGCNGEDLSSFGRTSLVLLDSNKELGLLLAFSLISGWFSLRDEDSSLGVFLSLSSKAVLIALLIAPTQLLRMPHVIAARMMTPVSN